MAIEGPWLLAAALEFLADGIDEEAAAVRLVDAARGSRDSLRGAYARALALTGELPDDRAATRVVDVLTRAMRRQWDLPALPVDAAAEAPEDLGDDGNVASLSRPLAARRRRVWEEPIRGIPHGIH